MTTFENGAQPEWSYEEVFAQADRVARETAEKLASPDPRYEKPQVLDVKCDPETRNFVFTIRQEIDKLPVEGAQVRFSVWKGGISFYDKPPEMIFEDHGWPNKGEDPGIDISDIENGKLTVQSRRGETTFSL